MSDLILLEDSKVDTWKQIQQLKNQGKSDTAIGKALGIPRKEVITLYEEFQNIWRDNAEAKDMALELLNNMISHYDDLISDHYRLLDKIRDEPFDDKYSNQELKALQQISDLVAKRLKAVQDAGLLENSELGDELADMEEKASILIDILRNDLCSSCRMHVAEKLQRATGVVEVISVQN